MHDDEAAGGVLAGVLSLPAGQTLPPPLSEATPADGPLLLPFVGGYGDAVGCIPVLRALQRHRPGAELTIATTPGPREIFADLGKIDARYIHYPPSALGLQHYAALLSLEGIAAAGAVAAEGFPARFARTLGVPFGPADLAFDLRVTLPAEAPAAEPGSPRVALAVTPGDGLRDWPAREQALCVRDLLAAGARVSLVGLSSGAVSWPHQPPRLWNLIGRTPSPAALAGWLAAMDAVIAIDSFPLHLAGALDVPALGLFGPTSVHHAAPYGRVQPLAGDAPCAPCHTAVGTCPLGKPACLALSAQPLGGDAVAEAALRLARQ
jgi:ADP-heptose:LPS heptosyltransferase